MDSYVNEILLRPGRPEDGSVASELIYSTGPYFFDHVFGDQQQTCRLLSGLFRKGSGIFSYHFSTIAEYQGEVAGLVLVYDGWQRHFHSLLNDFYVLTRYSPGKIIWMLYRDFHVKRFIKRIPHRSLYVANLAVMPQFQGKGVGRLLLQHAIETARSSGYASCSLDASVKNTTAVNLYQKMGFVIASTIHHKKLEERYQLEGQFRMIKKLSI